MQSISISLTAVVFLALIALLVAAVAVPVEIVGTLQHVNAVPPSGKIMGIQERPYLSFTPYEVEEDSRFRFTRDSEGFLVIHAVDWSRSPTERLSDAVTNRVITTNSVPDQSSVAPFRRRAGQRGGRVPSGLPAALQFEHLR